MKLTSRFKEKHILEEILRPASRVSLNKILKGAEKLKIDQRPPPSFKSTFKPTPRPINIPNEIKIDLVQQPAVNVKDIEEFIIQRSDVAPYTRAEKINEGILMLISQSTPNNLRTIMLFLAKYWQSGLLDTKPTIKQCREQARTLLLKSLECHPPTTHEHGGEQTGIPDMHKFDTFVNRFFEYCEVKNTPSDELNELILQLHARSGHLSHAIDLIGLAQRHSTLSENTIKAFVNALRVSKQDIDTLVPYKHVLLNSQLGGTVVKYLLPFLTTPEEIIDLLAYIDRSALRVQVYSECKDDILQRLREVNGLNMLCAVEHRINASLA